MSDSDSSVSPVRYATIERHPEDSKQTAITALNDYLKDNMHNMQLKTLVLLIANVGIAFGENAHTWTLAKNYLTTICTLKDHFLATANALIPIAINLCYPAYGGQPIVLRRKHARQLQEPWFSRRLRWNQAHMSIDNAPEQAFHRAVLLFQAYAPGAIKRDLRKIFPEKFALRLQDALLQ